MKKIISTKKAPEAIGAYSQGVEVKNMLFISGQIPAYPENNFLVDGDIKKQTEQVLKNIKSILDEASYTFSDVVKCTCYLKDISDFQEMNKVYEKYFSESLPARAAVEVARLPKDVLIEIDAIAVK